MTGKCSCPSWGGDPIISARLINDASGGSQDGGYLWECFTADEPAAGWGGTWQQDDSVTGGHGVRTTFLCGISLLTCTS